jgi:TonB family protein
VQGKEGWVVMSYMIDPQGIPYDVAVVSSSGDDLFERAAVSAAEVFRYEPAELQGEPMDAGVMSTITFQLSGDTGASRRFIRVQTDLLKAISENDRERADELLSKLDTNNRNLYEQAYLFLSKYRYHLKWGDLRQQYAALSRASFIDRGREFLPADTLTSVLSSMLVIELKLNKVAKALRTAKLIQERELQDSRKQSLKRVIANIENMAANDASFAIDGRIDGDNRFSHYLLKSSFEIVDVQGQVAEMRLHCDKDYVGFRYEAGLRYRVKEDLNDCVVTVIGDPGTTFRLVES